MIDSWGGTSFSVPRRSGAELADDRKILMDDSIGAVARRRAARSFVLLAFRGCRFLR